MDLTPSPEQVMLRESVRRFVEQDYTFEKRKSLIAAGADERRTAQATTWRRFADLGWLAAGFAEDAGGLGGGIGEQAIVMEEFGRGLVIEPYLGATMLSGRILDRAASPRLVDLIDGSQIFATAWAETASRYDFASVTTRAEPEGDGYQLTGRKVLALGGDLADNFIVSAATADGLALFLLPLGTPGLSCHIYRCFDNSWAADLQLNGARLTGDALLVEGARGAQVLQEALDCAAVGLAAGLVGAMTRATELTNEFVAQRKQFGNALAEFQVTQHRLVDMLIATEQSRSILLYGLSGFVDPEADRACRVAACMIEVLEAARIVTGSAVHQHGGIGMTNDLMVGHFYRLALIADKLFGDQEHYLGRHIAAEPGLAST